MDEALNGLLERFDCLWAEDDEPRVRSFARMYVIKAFESGAEWARLKILEGASDSLLRDHDLYEKA